GIDHRDQLIVENSVYLFAMGLPRQANRRKCCLSVRGVLAVTSNSPEMSFNYSRCARRDKQIAETAVYLFAVSSPRQANRRKSRLSIHGEHLETRKSQKSRIT